MKFETSDLQAQFVANKSVGICKHCQKRIAEEGYSQLDLKGENYWENESDYIQSNFERFN